MRFVIKTALHSPRLNYVARWIFEYIFHSDFKIITENDGIELKTHEDFFINYATEIDPDAQLNIFAHHLLSDSDIKDVHIEVKMPNRLPYFFEQTSSDSFDLPFDIFSLIFYLLSRYEEYLPSELDQHDRYKSSNSLAFKNAFLRNPIVDLWVIELRHLIEKKTNKSITTPHQYSICPTIDVDLPYAYRKRPLKKLAALTRDISYMRRVRVGERLKQWRSNHDPFDTYQYILDQLGQFPNTIWFFLCHFEKPYDENHLLNDSLFEDLIRKVCHHHSVGIHPSYSSDNDNQKVKAELDLLKKLSDQQIKVSRQHYLRMNLPDTYRTLIRLGISEDHSMMYPDKVGFRASTCHPFRWYDLKAEEETNLTIYSPCAMDVTLKDYMKLNVEDAKTTIQMLKQSIREVNGRFEYIWHNSSFSIIHGWKGWQEVFEEHNNLSL